jgi:hypothetical protein
MGQGASGAGAGDSKPTEQQAAQREKVFREIVATENTYVANLALVQQHFLEPLKNKKVLTEAEIAQVFNNLEVLLGQHRQLLAALKARESTWAKEDQVADIFLKQTECVFPSSPLNANYPFAKVVRLTFFPLFFFLIWFSSSSRAPRSDALSPSPS